MMFAYLRCQVVTLRWGQTESFAKQQMQAAVCAFVFRQGRPVLSLLHKRYESVINLTGTEHRSKHILQDDLRKNNFALDAVVIAMLSNQAEFSYCRPDRCGVC